MAINSELHLDGYHDGLNYSVKRYSIQIPSLSDIEGVDTKYIKVCDIKSTSFFIDFYQGLINRPPQYTQEKLMRIYFNQAKFDDNKQYVTLSLRDVNLDTSFEYIWDSDKQIFSIYGKCGSHASGTNIEIYFSNNYGRNMQHYVDAIDYTNLDYNELNKYIVDSSEIEFLPKLYNYNSPTIFIPVVTNADTKENTKQVNGYFESYDYWQPGDVRIVNQDKINASLNIFKVGNQYDIHYSKLIDGSNVMDSWWETYAIKLYKAVSPNIPFIGNDETFNSIKNKVYPGFEYYNTTLQEDYIKLSDNKFYSKRTKLQYGVKEQGTTLERPTSTQIYIGFRYFDTSLNKPIWWTGEKWINSQGIDADSAEWATIK